MKNLVRQWRERVLPFETMPRAEWDFHPDEARSFLAAIEAGVLRIDPDDATYSWPGLRARHGVPGLLGPEGNPPRIHYYREGVTQAATLADLHMKYEWPMGCLEWESGPPHQYFDLLVYSHPTSQELVIAVEIKPSTRDLNRLLEDMDACLGMPPHQEVDCGRRQHPKVAGLRALRPRYFMAVAPGTSRPFRLEWNEDEIALTPATYVPHYVNTSPQPEPSD